MQPLLLEKAGLENDYLRAKIASEMRLATQAGTGPGMPVPGMGVNVPVQYPGLGQEAENNYSDIGGLVYGGAAMLNDWANAMGGAGVLATTAKEARMVRDALNRVQSLVVNYPY